MNTLVLDSYVHLIKSKLSLCWRDLEIILDYWGVGHNWFGKCIVDMVENGASIDFWKCRWIGDDLLQYMAFLLQFENLQNPSLKIKDACT